MDYAAKEDGMRRKKRPMDEFRLWKHFFAGQQGGRNISVLLFFFKK